MMGCTMKKTNEVNTLKWEDLEQLASHLEDFFDKEKKKKVTEELILNELRFFWEVYIDGKGLHGDWKYK